MKLRFLLSLLILPLNGQDEVLPLSPTEEQIEEEEKQNKDARFRIPLGAIISDIVLPYYNKENRQVSLLTAQEMTLEGGDTINDEAPTEIQRLCGKDLKLWLFDQNGEVHSTTAISSAEYDMNKEQLTATGDLVMQGVDDQFAARSNGAIFTLKTGQALLMGESFTRFRIPERKTKTKTKTTMNLRQIFPLTAAMQMLVAAPPPVDPDHFAKFERLFAPRLTPALVDPDHFARFERLVAPRLIPRIDADDQFEKADLLNAELAHRLAEYLKLVGKTEILTQVKAPPVADEKDPFDGIFKTGPNDMSISSDQGVYLDSAAHEIAYFGNIKAQAQGLKLTCNKDLKIIFNPPPEKKADPKKEKKKEGTDDSPLKSFSGFGDVKQITASGEIRIEGETKGDGEATGQKFYIGGDRALFESDPANPKTDGTITLRGDKLALLYGDPFDEKSEAPLIQQTSTSKDAWAIIKIKENKKTGKVDATIQLSLGNWTLNLRDRKKK